MSNIPKELNKPITVSKCTCGHKGCNKYWLSCGSFVQGSGFEKETANIIANIINDYLLAEAIKNN